MPIKAGKCILGNEDAVFEFGRAVQREQYTFSSIVKRILKKRLQRQSIGPFEI